MPQPQRTLKRGFTLVEMLIVLAVIAILSAILFAVFRSVRENGRRTTCQNNLKQMTLAMQQYVQDNDGLYPQVGFSKQEMAQQHGWFWVYRLRGYLKDPRLQQCPSYGGERPNSAGTGVSDDSDYLYNYQRLSQRGTLKINADGTLWRDGQHEAAPLNATTTWLYTDMEADMINPTGAPTSRPSYTGSCGRTFGWETRHSGGANYSFIDGHVKWFRPEQMSEIECGNGPLPARATNLTR